MASASRGLLPPLGSSWRVRGLTGHAGWAIHLKLANGITVNANYTSSFLRRTPPVLAAPPPPAAFLRWRTATAHSAFYRLYRTTRGTARFPDAHAHLPRAPPPPR